MEKKYSVLCVYELIPEESNLFILTLNKDELEKVKKCNGHYVNYGDTPEECVWLNDLLSPGEEKGTFKYPDKVTQVDIKAGPVDLTHPNGTGKFDVLVHTGFGL